MINLMIIYNVVNIFSMKNHKSSRKLRVGVNWYPGMNWSTTTNDGHNVVGDVPHYIHTIPHRAQDAPRLNGTKATVQYSMPSQKPSIITHHNT